MWIKTSEQLPQEGKIVQTKISDDLGERNHQALKRQGRLWFVPDGSIYVYYTPTHWQSLGEQA